jgi:DNA-binding LacI/PurR family transcriptional regulator
LKTGMRSSETTGRKKVTMKNVAALSGVSYQTVSRVINGMPDVSDKTRRRVQKIMKKVGFRPNMTARQLRSRRSTTVGLVTFATGYYGPSQVLTNSEQCVKELGFGFMFSGIVEESIDEIRRAVDELCAYQVCGILIHLPLQVDLRGLQDLSRNVPLVAVDSDFGFQAPSVVIDNELGSRIATRHLIERAHEKIAYLQGPPYWRASKLRYLGWQKELKAARLKQGPLIQGDWSAGSGFEAVKKMLAQSWGKFTALVVANDQMALGAIRAFQESGIRIPEDISIVGFDDIPEAGFFGPPLSTMKQDFGALGKLSVQCLMEHLNGTQSGAFRISPTFIERKSTLPLGLKNERARRKPLLVS